MKNLKQIYESIKYKFFKNTKLDIEENTVMDLYTLSISSELEDVYKEIEDNKNPYFITNLKNDNLDNLGFIVGCNRQENEDDKSYFYRIINWNISNKSSNQIAIETSLLNLKYSSAAPYVPFTRGVGTGSVYVIPKNMEDKEKALLEVKERLSNVICTTSDIELSIPDIISVKLYIYASLNDNTVKNNLKEKILKYINGIAPGSFLSFGDINKIGVNEPGVNYFSINQILLNENEMQTQKVMQQISSKFIFDEIIWLKVVE